MEGGGRGPRSQADVICTRPLICRVIHSAVVTLHHPFRFRQDIWWKHLECKPRVYPSKNCFVAPGFKCPSRFWNLINWCIHGTARQNTSLELNTKTIVSTTRLRSVSILVVREHCVKLLLRPARACSLTELSQWIFYGMYGMSVTLFIYFVFIPQWENIFP